MARLTRGLKNIVLLCGLFLAAPAIAGREDTTWNPPPEFDFPFPGTMEVRRLPQPLVVKECSKISGGRLTALDRRGCSKKISKTFCRVVIVDKTYRGATPEAVLRHEQGHCNGWKHPYTN